MSGGRVTRFTERRARGLPRSSLLRARAWAAGVGVREGRTPAPGWPGPREGPRRGARRAIVWADALGAVVVCARAELCAAPAPQSRAAARIGRSSSVALCAGNPGGEGEDSTVDFGSSPTPSAFNMHFPASISHLCCPGICIPVSFLFFLGSCLGIVRCSKDWTWKSFSYPGSRSFTSVVCRRCLNLRGAGKRGPGFPLTAVGPCISVRVQPETRGVPPRQSAVPRNFSADVGTLQIPAWSPSPLPLPVGHSCQQPLLSSVRPWLLMLISGQLMITELSLLKISCSVPVSFTPLIYVGFPPNTSRKLGCCVVFVVGKSKPF